VNSIDVFKISIISIACSNIVLLTTVIHLQPLYDDPVPVSFPTLTVSQPLAVSSLVLVFSRSLCGNVYNNLTTNPSTITHHFSDLNSEA